ncbi:MAG TPA: hypothetical protein VF196_02280 [Casimicrobiaceae bacterium]
MSWQPPDDPSDVTAFDPRRSKVPPLVIPPRAAPVDLGDVDEDEGHGRDVPWGAAAALAAVAVIAALALAVDREGRRVVTVSSNATGGVTGTAPSRMAASTPASRPAEAPTAVGAERADPAGRATGDEPCAPAVAALGLCEAMPR